MYLCPSVSPPITETSDAIDGSVSQEELECAADKEEAEEMDIALQKGKSFDQGSNISQGTLCGPTGGDGPMAQKPMMLRGPIEPTQLEIDIHNLTHLPYMSWCPHCVATRRPNVAHKSPKVESTIP